MKNLILLISLILTYPTFSQTLTDNGVLVPLPTYRLIREKWYLCDSIINTKNEEIGIQDSIITNQEIQIESYKLLVIQKDTTIYKLSTQLLTISNKQSKPLVNTSTWIAGVIGLIIGILLVR